MKTIRLLLTSAVAVSMTPAQREYIDKLIVMHLYDGQAQQRLIRRAAVAVAVDRQL